MSMRADLLSQPLDEFFEMVYFREIELAMDTCLSPEERVALWEYAEKGKGKPNKRVQRAIQKIRAMLGITVSEASDEASAGASVSAEASRGEPCRAHCRRQAGR